MPLTCRVCSRANPPDAHYCYYDGVHLGGDRAAQLGHFPGPFIFPNGTTCNSFDQLVIACHDHWADAVGMLQQGYFERFLGGIGRVDLARAAREAAAFPDPDRGLDQFLGRLPGAALQPAKLRVEPPELSLGRLSLNIDRTLDIHLVNQGMRLLYGTAACDDSPWLVLGEGAGAPQKVFQCVDSYALKLQIRGHALRASSKPLEAHLVIDTNGGTASVTVRAEVPITPYPSGVLAGATTPRQLAEKMKANPRDASAALESGTVAAWYASNGWAYPVQGTAATGIGAVQQFFEALGLTAPPKVEVSERFVLLRGNIGQELRHSLRVSTPERRPVYAHAVSNQPWLKVRQVQSQGRAANVELHIPAVPHRPGETLQGRVTITANGNQRFVVPVNVEVPGTAVPVLEVVDAEPGFRMSSRPAVPVLEVVDAEPDMPSAVPVLLPADIAEALPTAQLTTPKPKRPRVWGHLLFLLLLLLTLFGLFVRDLFVTGQITGRAAEPLLDLEPRLAVRMHDREDPPPRVIFDKPTYRFGLVMLREPDPTRQGEFKRLTYDERGRSNNTVVRIDGDEGVFGDQLGHWSGPLRPVEKEGKSWPRSGYSVEWTADRVPVSIVQEVEIVPGEQSRLLDTCLVHYTIKNGDTRPHTVGLRFMLDTFIGTNDGVPFTIPGQTGLCDSFQEFNQPSEIPDFIQALEREDLTNPGTIAHLQLRVGGSIESPQRVTLGSWPAERLGLGCKEQSTGWNVPVHPMNALGLDDSAVVLYWNERELAPGATREVGFAYGLGRVAAGESAGRLALTVGGSFTPGGTFTVTAYVHEPQPGQTVTLTLPEGFQLVEGSTTQPVAPLPAGAPSRNSPVTWKVKSPLKAGEYTLSAQTSDGARQSQPVKIRSRGLFD